MDGQNPKFVPHSLEVKKLEPRFSSSIWPRLILALVVFIFYFSGGYFLHKHDVLSLWPYNSGFCCLTSLSPVPTQETCTKDAKICPDGSYVGRTGPNCEFASCPVTNIIYGSQAVDICGQEPPIECGRYYRLGCNVSDRKWGCYLEPVPSDWQTYRNDEYGFEFNLPAGWKQQGDPWSCNSHDNNCVGLTFASPDSQKRCDKCGSLSIRIYKNPKSLSILDFYSSTSDYFEIDNGVIEDILVDGRDAKRIYNFVELYTTFQIAIINNHDEFIEFIDTTSEKLLDQILSTFKFINFEIDPGFSLPFNVGDKVGDMEVLSVEPFFLDRIDKIHADNFRVRFKGEQTISGTYSVNYDPGPGCVYSFRIDENSKNDFPKIRQEDNVSFCFNKMSGNLINQFFNQEGSGRATIVIDDYEMVGCGCDAFDSATLVKVISKN